VRWIGCRYGRGIQPANERRRHALCREAMEGPLMPGKGSASIRIPESKEASHQFRMGDTGTGKTSLTYQDLLDAEANEICCVVNDAKGGEILARFYRPERGDVVLNPTDDRCAYWNISS